MTQEQSQREVIDLKILAMKCFIAETKLATFLLDKADSTVLPLDDTFKLKHMVERVRTLIRQLEASEEVDKRPPDKLPVYANRRFERDRSVTDSRPGD